MAASLSSRYISGALAWYQTHRMRLIDVIGDNVTKYILTPEKLGPDATDPRDFTTTVVEAGAGTTEFSPGNDEHGTGVITPAGNENDGGNYQLLGERFKFTTSNVICLYGKWKFADVDQQDFFFGFAITDTDILGGVTDRIGFQTVDGDAGLDLLVEKDSTETSEEDIATLVDNTYVEMELYWDGPNSKLYAFIDGAAVTAPAITNLPDDEELRLTIQDLNGEAAVNIATFEKQVRAIQVGA